MVIRDQCAYDQFRQIAAALYGILDEEHVDRAKENKANDPNANPLLQVLAFRSLPCIIDPWIREEQQEDHRKQAIRDFTSHWLAIHRWILYLKQEYVDNNSVDIAFRIAAKRSLVNIIGLASHKSLDHYLPVIFNSPLIVHIVFSLWRLEVQDRRFSYIVVLPAGIGLTDIHSTPAILDRWQASFMGTPSWNWDEIIRCTFDNDATIIASTAIAQLRHDVEKLFRDYDRIIPDIHLMTVFSLRNDIRMSMLRHGSLLAIVGLMLSLVLAQHSPDIHPLVSKVLCYACWYVRAYVEVSDGLPWIAQVLEAGILKAIVLIEPYIKHMPHPDDWDPLHELFREVIPRYTVYRSILTLIVKYTKEIEEAGWAEKYEEHSPMWYSWGIYDDQVQWKAPLLKVEGGMHIHTCQNSKVFCLWKE